MKDNTTIEKLKIHLVPHTHWDREWYFTLEEFRYRLVKMMDLLLECMESGEIEYFVADGQTIMLEDYLDVRPENRERIKKLICSKRLFIGPWYTQPNIFMSGAEAQVRNLLFGRRQMDEWGGGMPDINYMPDQFGFTSQLPQMMKEFGMTHLIGARGLPKQCDTYLRWVGADQSEVHICVLPHSYINACGLSEREEQKVFSVFGEKIVMPSMPERMDCVLSEKNRAISPQILALNGVDHMYPNPRMKKTLEKVRERYPDIQIEESNFYKYISETESTLTKEPETCYGEQRDGRENFILPGSQSTRMDVKKYNRKMENFLERRVEPLLCKMIALEEDKLPMAEFRMAWDLILQNHSHDSLCCANSDPSYREIITRYEKADDISREICNELEQRLIRRIHDYPQEAVLICNPSPFERNEPITVDVIVSNNRNFAEPHLFYEDTEIPAVINGVKPDMLLRYVPFSGLVGQLSVAVFNMTIDPGNLPASGCKLLEVRGGMPHQRPVEGIVCDANSLENEYLFIKVESDASVTVKDKRTGHIYTGLNRFMDSGETGCGFIHSEPYTDSISVSHGANISIEINENNRMKGELSISQSFEVPKALSVDKLSRNSEKSTLFLTSKIILRKGCPYLEFETDVINTAVDHRLRVCFPSDTKTTIGYAGQPYDVIERPVQPENVNLLQEDDYEAFKGYHPMLDFCGITDGLRGAAVVGDGFTEYEILPMRNTLCLTMIRATDRLHVGVLGSGSKFKIPLAQLQGKQSYRYAFIPHTGNYSNALQSVEEFRNPLYAVQKDFLEAECMPDYVPKEEILPMQSGFISLEGKAVLSCIKPAENGDGLILRFYNPEQENISTKVIVDETYILLNVSRCRMDEMLNKPLTHEERSFVCEMRPKEIVTIRLNIKKRINI